MSAEPCQFRSRLGEYAYRACDLILNPTEVLLRPRRSRAELQPQAVGGGFDVAEGLAQIVHELNQKRCGKGHSSWWHRGRKRGV
jgi:hypothetical protein